MKNHFVKSIIFSGFLLLISGTTKAQDQPFLGAYSYNWQLINPGTLDKLLAVDDLTPFAANFLARRQWEGLEGAPQTYFASIEHRLMNNSKYGRRRGRTKFFKIKYGLSVLFDKTDAYSSATVGANLSGYFSVGYGKTIHIGFSPTISSYQIDLEKLNFKNPGENAIFPSNFENQIHSNVGVGIFFKNRKKLYAGISIPGMFQFVPVGSRPEKVLNPYFNVISGFYYRFLDQWKLEPSLWMRYIPGVDYLYLNDAVTPIAADVNLRFHYFRGNEGIELFWFGAGSGMSRNLHVEFGTNLPVGIKFNSISPSNQTRNQYLRLTLSGNHPFAGYLLSPVPSYEVGVAFAWK